MSKPETLSLKLLLNWHNILFIQTKPDIAGKTRDYLVRIGSYLAPDWQNVKPMLREFFSWYKQNKNTLHPIELAARAHYKFENIHPFGDGNGRIGRLLITSILRTSSFPILVVLHKKRKSYYHALSKTENDFLLYFVRRYIADFKNYL